MTDYSFTDDEESLTFVIKRLVQMKAKLTDWESKFIHNIQYKRESYTGGYQLSAAQKQVVSDMWEKY